jgi:hypothetical protein
MITLQALFRAVFGFLSENDRTTYLHTGTTPQSSSEPSQYILDIAGELDFGRDKSRLVEMAVRNHPLIVNQEKWLRAIKVLKGSTHREWILNNPINKAVRMG